MPRPILFEWLAYANDPEDHVFALMQMDANAK